MARWTSPARSSRPGVYREASRRAFARRRTAPFGRPGQLVLGRAVEADTARTLTAAKVVAIGRAAEADAAFAVICAKVVEIGQATETTVGRAVTVSFAPGGTLLPELLVEVAFNIGAATAQYLTIGDPTRGIIGVGKIAPNDVGELGGVWTDITAWVRSGSTKRGSSRVDSPVIKYEAGTATLTLDNSDRRFDPTHLHGPYVVSGRSQITPMRAVRIRAKWADTIYELFRGYADLWDISWSGPNYSECVLTATDGFKVLAGNSRAAVAAVGAGEDTGARINRILDSAGWSSGDRVIDTGDLTLQATTLEGDTLAELQLAADSEIGELYIDGGGRTVFRNRSAITEEERSAIAQAEFGDGGGTELPYQELNIANDDATLFNQVRVTIAGGTEQTANDASSQATYLIRTFERSDLILQTDAAALAYARYILARTSEPELRFESIGIDPRRLPASLYPQVLGREFGDRISVVRRPPGGGFPIRRDVWIRGVEHTFAPKQWRTGWIFQQADPGPAPAPRPLAADPLRRRVRIARPPVRARQARRLPPLVLR